jgi:VCBS repeat-containing protein
MTNSANLSFSLDAPVAGLILNTDGTYSFNTAHSAYQYLPQGATATIVANYTATDENDVSSSSTLTIVVTGANDLPTASAVTGSVNEDVPAVVTINASITDVDVGDTYSLSFSGGQYRHRHRQRQRQL